MSKPSALPSISAVLYQIRALDIRYDISFRTPFFNLPRNTLDVWQALYKHLAPKFIVQASDFHTVTGSVLSQVRATLNLFRGNATIDVSAEQLNVLFRNATEPGDSEIVQDCLIRVVTALSTLVPESQFGVEHVTLHATLAIDGGDQGRRAVLDGFRTPASEALAQSEGTWKITPAFHIDIENESPQWMIAAELSRAWVDNDCLFFALNAYFGSGASAAMIPERTKIVSYVGQQLLQKLGLQPKQRT